MPKKPWEFTDALLIERLQRIAHILRETRLHTVTAYDPKVGDGPWSTGCLVYERSINRIGQASRNLPWLEVLSDSLEFVFAIGGVPIRFYRGDGDNPSNKQLACCHTEIQQLSLIDQQANGDLIWRLAVETDAAGFTTKIVLVGFEFENVGARDKSIVCYYEIPESLDNVSLFPDRPAPRGEGVDLPAATPSLPTTADKENNILDDSDD